MQNFPQQLQTPISHKQQIFSGFFIAYLECASNLKHFEKKDEHPSLVISEIIDFLFHIWNVHQIWNIFEKKR